LLAEKFAGTLSRFFGTRVNRAPNYPPTFQSWLALPELKYGPAATDLDVIRVRAEAKDAQRFTIGRSG